MNSLYIPVLRFPNLTPQRLHDRYLGGCHRADPTLDGLCHVDLATKLLFKHGFLGWRIGGGTNNVVYSAALWVSKEAQKAVFNRTTLADPNSLAAIIWTDTLRLNESNGVELAGVFGVDWVPPNGFRVRYGENIAHQPGLPSAHSLPRLERQ